MQEEKRGFILELQEKIIDALKVEAIIQPAEEIRRRIDFIKAYLLHSKQSGLVLGISGGQDSTLTGKLCQMAITELNRENHGKSFTFFAVRLPYGIQQDEQDAQDSLDFIQPDKRVTINIKPAVDAAVQSFYEATGMPLSNFNKGNTKARERMKAQYDIGAHFQCLVVGTDHAAEAVTGFYTKHGDGACDLAPIFGLTKSQGKQLLQELGCPKHLYEKAPTADLEDDKPGLPDEEALGMTYEQLDAFLQGNPLSSDAMEKIVQRYIQTEHKRQLPVTVYDTWWKQ
ncbi:ammonia-dependent NAD(+) synthetase [Alkalihalobacillus sp. LMS39]|uniref:ammonia-dependent NAD(+) synthetase n=1 Tax=Alkalihalobacillus sp. LMS39 TaxID=2924032 RepID=UPI001FB51398|nr:ammonia-dependent NAD(+) synthetase [Alkalihalobacillus sp. LMS39]UOE92640.1 ammonia-dependent NAD(+) synthetase [Alkalihalobacillus sp. LMS39]